MKKSVKKFISVACVLATLLVSLSMGLVFTGAANETTGPEIWDGSTADSYAAGSGDGSSADAAILIENGAQLYKAIIEDKGNGLYYKLTKDIYLNNVSADNWYEGTCHNWPNRITFNGGTIDGDGHVVYGLYSDKDERIGLLPQVSGTVVLKNLGVDYAYLYSNGSVNYPNIGALIGCSNGDVNVTVSQCYAGENVIIKSANSGGEGFGGLIGNFTDTSKLNMQNCYCLAKFEGVTRVTGNNSNILVGRVCINIASDRTDDIVIKNCYGIDTGSGASGSMGILSANACNMNHFAWHKNIFNLYCVEKAYTGYISSCGYEDFKARIHVCTEAQMTGANAVSSMTELDFVNTWKAVAGTYPKLRVFLTEEENNIWCGEPAAEYAGGDGTETDPYLVSNGGQLYKAIITDGGAGKYYKLTADIQLNDTTGDDWYTKAGTFNWPSEKSFTGTIDGAGHVVRGLYSENDQRIGLIPQASGTVVIRNLGVDDAYLKATSSGWSYVAGFVGIFLSGGDLTIDQSYVGANVEITGKGQGVGGMVGFIQDYTLHIENCYSVASIVTPEGFSTSQMGAVIGQGWVESQDWVTIGGWVSQEEAYIQKVYAFAPNAVDKVPFSSTFARNLNIWNVYGSYKGDSSDSDYNAGHFGYISLLTADQMKGTAAKAKMPVLDFTTIWAVDPEGGYPVLQVFQPVSAIAYQQLETAGTTDKAAVRFRFNLNTDAKNVTAQVTDESGAVTAATNFKNATVVASGKEYKIDSIYAVYAYKTKADAGDLTLENAAKTDDNNKYIKSVEITKLQKAMTDELGRPVFTVRISVPASSKTQTVIVRPVLKLVDPATSETFEVYGSYIEGAAANA